MITDKMVTILFGFIFIMGIIGLLIPTSTDPFMVAGKIFLGIILISIGIVSILFIIYELKED